jgi:hypothetical protein
MNLDCSSDKPFRKLLMNQFTFGSCASVDIHFLNVFSAPPRLGGEAVLCGSSAA